MRYLLTLILLCLSAAPANAQQPAETWILVQDMWGNPAYSMLTLVRVGEQLTGDIDGDPLHGRATAGTIEFSSQAKGGGIYRFSGSQTGTTMAGKADFPDNNFPDRRALHTFTARRIADRPAGAPRTWHFQPVDYANSFDPHRAPVLTIWPGDSVETSTVDSGGVDAAGNTVALFGNPQTGPFFIAGAAPGDMLAVHIKRLRLNRDYADSLDTIVGRALGSSLVARAGELGKPVRWTLDRKAGRARPQGASGALKDFSIAVRPMLGGLAVAPGFGSAPLSTGDTGPFGGNMDFNEVVEGNIVYLPVQQPGALLYLGDAHALQGDGETSQYALETSMDVAFRVELIKGKRIAGPRVESPDRIMVLGQAGSLDEALKSASTGMILWLQQDYGLTLSQTAQILGTAMHYSVANLAGRSVGVAAKLDKAVLPPKATAPVPPR
ncbi:acetamidase/formamidase family protein [Sphingomonas sp.]|uniref:acetamidase/formamidase family protein n=1 Tax=Sphingomonas sp. TaxID=28214 RepID=UPI003D6CD828